MIIGIDISEKVLMVGVHFKENATGGMATVIQNYESHIENLKYIATWKPGNILVRLFMAITAYLKIFCLLLFDKRIKIVHIHGAAYGSYYRKKHVIKISKLFKKKIIYHMHGGEFKHFFETSVNKPDIIRTINNCDVCIVLSNSWKTYFESIGITSSHIYILNNSIEKPSLKKCKTSSKTGTNILKTLFLGTLVKEKGIFDLLDVLIKDKDYFSKNMYLVIGGVKNEAIIKDIIKQEKIDQFVEFKGWISKEDREKEYSDADVLILPSYFEALPMVILEAMSFNCAVLSTDVGGIPDVIIHNMNGELIQAGDKMAIRDALIRFIEDRDIIYKYQKSGQKIIQSFYPDKVFKNLKSIYQELLSHI